MSAGFVIGIDPRPVPLIEQVEPGPGAYVLSVTWKNGGRISIDLSGWIALHDIEALRVLSVFNKPEIGEHGDTVQWAGDEDLSIDSVHLELLAEQQRHFGIDELVAWQERHGLSNQEAADMFALHVNTWINYRNGTTPMPRALAIACRAIDRDPLPIAAFLRPRRPGRPPAAAE